MKRNGFTIVEVVIVIAVVATLAAVTIPTFSGIIQNANISADIQTTRNMNTFLSAESAKGAAPASEADLIALLEENGFSKFRPQTKFFNFYWIKDLNVIVLTNEDGDPVFPEEYVAERYNKATWLSLENAAGGQRLPTAPEENIEQPRQFPVTLKISGGKGITFNVEPTATEGQPFHYEFLIPEDPQDPNDDSRMRIQITKVSATMKNGDEVYNIDGVQEFDYENAFSAVDVPFSLDIPCVTGEIDIRVTIKEFCKVTYICDNPDHLREDQNEVFTIWCQKGMKLRLHEHQLKRLWLSEQYKIVEAKAYSDESTENYMGDLLDKNSSDTYVTRDIWIELKTKLITYEVTVVIKDQHGGVQFKNDYTVEYDTETDSGALSIDLPATLANCTVSNHFVSGDAQNNEMTPSYTIDLNELKLSITNIQYKITLNYFVKIPE